MTADGIDDPTNLVRLRGRVTAPPAERELPSGTRLVTWRISVPRTGTPLTTGTRQTTDWVDCVAAGPSVVRYARAWAVGDEVELVGALRRRFLRAATGTATKIEVEVLSGRRRRRSADR